MKHYLEYTKMTPEELVMEKWEDQQTKPTEREDVAELRVYNFYKWLREDYKIDEQWVNNDDKSVSSKTATTYVGAVRSFYKANGVPLNKSGFGRGTCARAFA